MKPNRPNSPITRMTQDVIHYLSQEVDIGAFLRIYNHPQIIKSGKETIIESY